MEEPREFLSCDMVMLFRCSQSVFKVSNHKSFCNEDAKKRKKCVHIAQFRLCTVFTVAVDECDLANAHCP